MRRVLGVALLVCGALYGTMGTVGLVRFCTNTPGNILLGFSHTDPLILSSMFAELVVCCLALPLLIYPVRPPPAPIWPAGQQHRA